MSDTVVAQLESAATVGEVNHESHEEVPAPVTPARKRAPAAPKLDADGNPIPKTPRKTATPKTKLDADGNLIPKTPRKPATPKQPKLDADGNPVTATPKTPRKTATPKQPKLDADGNPITATPKKSASKAKAKAVKTESFQDGATGVDSAAAADNVNGAEADDVAPPATPASKKRASIAGAETPSKRAKATPVKGNAIPSSKADLSEADRMLMDWRESGKSWADIRTEYARLTGKPVGNSTLPNRYVRLKASLVELKDGDMELVLYAKDIIAEELALELEAYKKKQETEIWNRIAKNIAGFGADTYSGDAIAKAYGKEKAAGFPHKQTDRYNALMLSGPDGDHASQESGEQDGMDIKDEVEVDFDANGDPVYTETAEMKTPGTVIHTKVSSEAPVNGTRKESVAESAVSNSTTDKSTSQEDDGDVFN